eukprot:1152157-Pelagomonas_calceolata.AAC.1
MTEANEHAGCAHEWFVASDPAAMAKWSRRLFSKEEIPGSIPGSSSNLRSTPRVRDRKGDST